MAPNGLQRHRRRRFPHPAHVTDDGAVLLGFIHSDTVHASFLHSVLALVGWDMAHDARVLRGGWLGMRCGAGSLPEARNKVVGAFLESDAEWLLWIDTDMGF